MHQLEGLKVQQSNCQYNLKATFCCLWAELGRELKKTHALTWQQDPSKPAVKKHHSIVIRAETPAEKHSWLRRLKICSEGPGAMRNLPPRPTLASAQV